MKCFALFFLFFCLFVTTAQAVDEPTANLTATQASEPITLDGQLSETCWQRTADLSGPLISFSPAFGTPLPFKTELWLAYDEANLYFAIRASDPEPEQIKTSMTKRDNIDSDDWVAVSLDTLGGRQSAYVLMVNPSGIQGDKHDTSSGADAAPDYVWYSAASRTGMGYVVEMQLPLKNFRFQSGQDVIMNIMLQRNVARSGMKSCWPAKRPSDSFLAVHHPVKYTELKKITKIELIPSFTYGALWDSQGPGTWSKPDDQANFGLTAKVGITSSINAEATINPDFSQVESDQMQVLVNQRYPLFYEEKRPFFMETGNLFNLAASDNSGDYNMYAAVHTRSIVDPQWGVKLTGEAGPAVFGFLTVRDQWPSQVEGGGANATFIIGRLKWNLGSDNYAGILFSGRNSQDDANNSLALDFSYKLAGKHHFSAKAILTSSDTPQSDAQNDSAYSASWGYYTKPVSTFFVYEHVGQDFRMDSSFSLRSGIRRLMGYVSPSYYPQNIPWIKRLNLMLWGYQIHDYQTQENDSLYFIALRTFFSKQANIRIDWRTFREFWAGQPLKGSYLFLGGQLQLTNALFFYASLDWGDKILYDPQSPLVGPGLSAQVMTLVQPNEQLALELSYTYEKLDHPDSGEKLYDVHILRSKNTFQLNKYLFLRGIVQYDSSQKVILSDILASFTLIPETVIHIGYGSVHEKMNWDGSEWQTNALSSRFYQRNQSFFFKASYRIQF